MNCSSIDNIEHLHHDNGEAHIKGGEF